MMNLSLKKFPVGAFIVFLFIGSIFFSGCTQEDSGNISTISIDSESSFSLEECKERNLQSELIMLESSNCPHCKLAMPKLQELEEELDVNVEYLDLSSSEDREKLDQYKILPKYTPTVLIGCNVLIGDKEKEVFKNAIEDWKNEQEN